MKITVSGIGCVCALGGNTAEIKKNIFSGGVEPSYAAGRLDSSLVSLYPAFQAPAHILKEKKENESYGFLFLRKAVDEALAQAGLAAEELRNVRVGVAAGTSVDASFNCFGFYKAWRAGQNVSYEPLLHYFNTPLSGALQKYYGVNGPQITVTTACASGTDAIGLAAQWIEQDDCDVAIACGTDELNMIPFTGFIRLMIAGKEPCAPFSNGRAGINLGEGAGVFILESDKFAKGRKANPLGYVLGYGCCCDAYHSTAPDPEGRGLKRAMERAMQTANIKKEDLAFINAHGTGTADNDAAEAGVFNKIIPGVPVMASKSYTGHTLGAAGSVEAALTLMCLNEKEIPAARLFLEADPALNLTPVIKNTKIENKETALSDSLAFGGCNSVIALGSERYRNDK